MIRRYLCKACRLKTPKYQGFCRACATTRDIRGPRSLRHRAVHRPPDHLGPLQTAPPPVAPRPPCYRSIDGTDYEIVFDGSRA